MKKLSEKINSDRDFNKKAYSYIKRQLDEETAKPIRKRGFNKIEQLTAELAELSDNETSDNSEGVKKLYGKIAEYEKANTRSARFIKKAIPAICCTAIIAAMNCVSVLAWDMNIVSAVIEFTQGGFKVSFDEQREVIELPTSEDDPYGIIAECAKYDIYPETPHYLPVGFELTDVDTHIDEEYANTVRFIFRNGKQNFSLDYTRYWNELAQMGIPSDRYNISETAINGNPAIISKEDNQYTITYINDKTVFLMFAQDVPYDECEKIVASIR